MYVSKCRLVVRISPCSVLILRFPIHQMKIADTFSVEGRCDAATEANINKLTFHKAKYSRERKDGGSKLILFKIVLANINLFLKFSE